MQKVPVQEAQTHLLDLLNAAIQGETVLIVRDDQQTVQLVPVSEGKKRRKAGSGKGVITMSEDFDEPLDDFRDYME